MVGNWESHYKDPFEHIIWQVVGLELTALQYLKKYFLGCVAADRLWASVRKVAGFVVDLK